ncbi:hypothetical protein NS228_01910 [Methylobacterium indicum]|uniref:Uncharacterized protein n=1 Tax=Methylobacterium indicum TaxID=1775910 RepID=A0ABR5HFD4_9HYPH|nr:hypothetical protein QR78_00830 [Methylobacterium indicum]KMO25278.1 hypothetical protein QR79_08520 [Methylobacterium indicum]KTS23843.1 hypothetical protein NS229_22295 [Methylobacterium indicum]KTS42571.1 hypothetical protein NS228_01910 [Methylobacterium indicum]KTS50301.1 hypothetical protein NS230_16365 [Methylobacterium indicum]
MPRISLPSVLISRACARYGTSARVGAIPVQAAIGRSIAFSLPARSPGVRLAAGIAGARIVLPGA